MNINFSIVVVLVFLPSLYLVRLPRYGIGLFTVFSCRGKLLNTYNLAYVRFEISTCSLTRIHYRGFCVEKQGITVMPFVHSSESD